MAVAHDAFSEPSGSQTGTFSWTHTPTGTPKGVWVEVDREDGSSTDAITGVTYGGVSMTLIASAVDSAGEPSYTELYFLGASIPTGAQTVQVTTTAGIYYAGCATQTAGGDTEIFASSVVKLEGDGTLAEQSVDDQSVGANSVRYAGGFSGLSSPPSVGANTTSLSSIDDGTSAHVLARETTAGAGARSVGFSDVTSDDRALLHWAVREKPQITYTSAVNTNSAATNHNYTVPSGIASGKLLVLLCCHSSGVETWNTLTGFTKPASGGGTGGGNGGITWQTYYKFTDGSETNGTVPTSGSCDSIIISYLFTGAHASTAPEFSATGASSTTADAPSLDPGGWGTEATRWIAWACAQGNQTVSGWTTLSGYSVDQTGSTGTGTANITGKSQSKTASAASENPGAVTITNSDVNVGMTIAIRPAAASSNTTVTPDVVALTTTKYAPKVNLAIIVPVKALATTKYAPQANLSVVVPVKALTTTKFAPQANLSIVVPTNALTLTTYPPAAQLPTQTATVAPELMTFHTQPLLGGWIQTDTPPPLSIALSIVNPTAIGIGIADINPVSITLSVVQPTATLQVSSTPPPALMLLATPIVTPTGHLAGGVVPEVLALSVPNVTGVFPATATIFPVSVTLAVPSVAATRSWVGVVTPQVITLSTVGFAAAGPSIATVAPVTLALSVVQPTAANRFTAVIFADNLFLSAVPASAVNRRTADVDPVLLTLSTPSVTGYLILTGVPNVQGLVLSAPVPVSTYHAAPTYTPPVIALAVPSPVALALLSGVPTVQALTLATPTVVRTGTVVLTAQPTIPRIDLLIVDPSATWRVAPSPAPVVLTLTDVISGAAPVVLTAAVQPVQIALSGPSPFAGGHYAIVLERVQLTLSTPVPVPTFITFGTPPPVVISLNTPEPHVTGHLNGYTLPVGMTMSLPVPAPTYEVSGSPPPVVISLLIPTFDGTEQIAASASPLTMTLSPVNVTGLTRVSTTPSPGTIQMRTPTIMVSPLVGGIVGSSMFESAIFGRSYARTG